MANLNPAVPTVIGRPQTARKNVHPVDMSNPWANVGRGLSNLGEGGLKLGLTLAGIQQERDDADYIRTRNGMIDTAIKRLNDEVYSQEGFAAEGSLDRAEQIFSEILNQNSKQMAKLTPRNQRKLQEDLGTWGNSQRIQVIKHERSHLQQANITANKAAVDRSIDQYAATLDEGMLNGALQVHVDNWRIQNGGHLTDFDALRRFDEDVADGDGYVRIRGGSMLKIVDDDSEDAGKPGTITKSGVQKQRAGMVREMEAYYQSRQNLLDVAHAKVIDNYIQNGMPEEAERYLKYLQTGGSVSDSIVRKSEFAIGNLKEKIGNRNGRRRRSGRKRWKRG